MTYKVCPLTGRLMVRDTLSLLKGSLRGTLSARLPGIRLKPSSWISVREARDFVMCCCLVPDEGSRTGPRYSADTAFIWTDRRGSVWGKKGEAFVLKSEFTKKESEFDSDACFLCFSGKMRGKNHKTSCLEKMNKCYIKTRETKVCKESCTNRGICFLPSRFVFACAAPLWMQQVLKDAWKKPEAWRVAVRHDGEWSRSSYLYFKIILAVGFLHLWDTKGIDKTNGMKHK